MSCGSRDGFLGRMSGGSGGGFAGRVSCGSGRDFVGRCPGHLVVVSEVGCPVDLMVP